MAKTKMKKTAPDAAERKKLSTKASRLRAKQRKGKELSTEEKGFLSSWEAKKGKGRPPKSEEPKAEAKEPKPEAKKAKLDMFKASGLSRPEPKAEAPAPKVEIPEPGPKPPPGPPPANMPLAPDDWRAKFRLGESREDQCKAIALLWAKGVKRMNADIVELEGTPILPDAVIDALLFPAMVLTVDKFTPEDLDVDPTIVSAVGTSVVVGQRLYAARTKKSVKEKKEESDAMRFVEPPAKASAPAEKKEEPKPAEPRRPATPGVVIEDHDPDDPTLPL